VEDSFTVTIEIPQSPPSVFARLRDVSKWWGGPDLAGRTAEAGDEFTVIHGDAHYSKQRVIEVVLQKDKLEWTGTRMIFEIAAENDLTKLRFTHEGLTPSNESYTRCAEGWATVITKWLFDLITKNKAHF